MRVIRCLYFSMLEQVILIFSALATVAFAVTGVMAAWAKSMDLFGAVILAVVTSVGGGTIRDILLGIDPVFWISDPTLFYIALVAGLASFPIIRRIGEIRERWLAYIDACGLALFTIVGVSIAESVGAAAPIAIIMGMITGCGGGILRDVLADRVPYVFSSEIYATASLAGGAVFYLMPLRPGSYVVGFLAVLILRLLAIHKGWGLPSFGHRRDTR